MTVVEDVEEVADEVEEEEEICLSAVFKFLCLSPSLCSIFSGKIAFFFLFISWLCLMRLISSALSTCSCLSAAFLFSVEIMQHSDSFIQISAERGRHSTASFKQKKASSYSRIIRRAHPRLNAIRPRWVSDSNWGCVLIFSNEEYKDSIVNAFRR